MNNFYMYILKCIDDFYYIGHTDNIEKRISEHRLGLIQSCYTYQRRPIEVMFVQIFATRYEALSMERRVKGWTRQKKEALISENWGKSFVTSKEEF